MFIGITYKHNTNSVLNKTVYFDDILADNPDMMNNELSGAAADMIYSHLENISDAENGTIWMIDENQNLVSSGLGIE